MIIRQSLYVCMYVCVYACMYVCMYVCVYVCMYVCVDPPEHYTTERRLLIVVPIA